jgi:hypothetical protein
MSLAISKILAASPNTERGRPTQLSADPKGERLAYAVSSIIRSGNLEEDSLADRSYSPAKASSYDQLMIPQSRNNTLHIQPKPQLPNSLPQATTLLPVTFLAP